MVVIVPVLVLGRLLLLDDRLAVQMDLLVDVAGDHVVPLREAVVEILDVLIAGGDLGIVLVLAALVLLVDAGLLGLAGLGPLGFLGGIGLLRLFLLDLSLGGVP